MKKYLIATTMMLTLAISAGAASQNHRHHADTVQITTVVQQTAQQADELEAFSDTTSTVDDSIQYAAMPKHTSITITEDDWEELFNLGDKGMFGALIALFIVLSIFVLAPILILALLFYLVYKNRRQRMKFAEQAMQNGQSIPDNVMNPNATTATPPSDLRTKGIRQLCLGVGLMILLYNVIGNLGMGIGALIACIGIGNLIIARQQNPNDSLNNNNHL